MVWWVYVWEDGGETEGASGFEGLASTVCALGRVNLLVVSLGWRIRLKSKLEWKLEVYRDLLRVIRRYSKLLLEASF